MRLFRRLRGFFKLFQDKWKFILLIWDILKDFEDLAIHFQTSG
jgi:hypothetical protein